METSALLNQAQSSHSSSLSSHSKKSFHHHHHSNSSSVPSSVSSVGSSSASSSPQPALSASPSSSSSSSNSQQLHQRHRKSNSILHVRENSLDELEALFDPSKRLSRANNLPLNKRNLPSSFFTQPVNNKLLRNSLQHTQNRTNNANLHHFNNNHGRQMSSIESSLSNGPKSIANPGNSQPFGNSSGSGPMNNNNGDPNLQMNSNNHLRSISEPVNMMPDQQQPLQQLHQNILNNNQNIGPLGSQLPYGWQSAKTLDNRVYYINYLTKETSWTLPNTQSNIQQQQFDLSEDNFDLLSLTSHAQTVASTLLVNTAESSPLNTDPVNKLSSNASNLAHLNMENNKDNGSLLALQSSSVSSLSSMSSSSLSSQHSASLSQDELQFNGYNNNSNNNNHHHSMRLHHHSSHHAHHHHPYLSPHPLNPQQQQQIQASQEHSHIQLSAHNYATLKSLNEYQEKVEYLLKITPVPSGWQKSQTDAGEIFFINHNTRSTCWDPRLKVIENYLQQQEVDSKLKHQQQQQQFPHNQQNLIELDFSLQNSNHNHHHQSTIPMYHNQMMNANTTNNRSNSTGVGSSSSSTNSNSVSPLFMLNSSNSNSSSNINTSGGNMNPTLNGINRGYQDPNMLQVQQQQKQELDLSDLLESNNVELNYDHQQRINNLIEIITKKKKLLKSLNELNKRESYLRSQLDSNYQNSNELYSPIQPVGSLGAANFSIKLEEKDINETNLKGSINEAPNNSDEDEEDDDDEVDLSDPEMTFISSEHNNDETTISNIASTTALIISNSNNSNVNNDPTTNKKAKTGLENQVDLDNVNTLYNKLLLHNNSNTIKNFLPTVVTNSNKVVQLTDEQNCRSNLTLENHINHQDNTEYNAELAQLTSNTNREVITRTPPPLRWK